MGEDGILKISGEGKLAEGTAEGSRMGQPPRDMAGKPRDWREGEPSRTSGERLELARRPAVREPGEVRLPISWYSATQVRVWDKVFALNNDMDDVFVVINDDEIEGTRTSTVNLSYAISNLMDHLLRFVGMKLEGISGFNKADFTAGRKALVMNMRRRFQPKLLIALANYFDTLKVQWLGQRIDNLRIRLEQLKPSTLEIPLESSAVHGTSEMLEPLPEEEAPQGEIKLKRKSIIEARAPFGVVHEKGSLHDKFIKILKWAIGQKKKGRKHELVVHEAKVKAINIMNASYEELTKQALRHAARRTGKKVGLSPDEVKRLEIYKQNSIEDFENILRDKLRRVKKK